MLLRCLYAPGHKFVLDSQLTGTGTQTKFQDLVRKQETSKAAQDKQI
jgi:hypothetical protein